MVKIIFHIGLHKTGSSYLQKYYFEKINYINYISYSVLRKYYNLIYRDYIFVNNWYLINLVKKDKINIISDEMFSGFSEIGFDSNSNYINLIYKFFPNAKIILFIRKQNSFARSNYLQAIGVGCFKNITNYYKYILNSPNMLDRGFFKINKDMFNYYNYCDFLISKFGKKNVLIIPYEEFNENNFKIFKRLDKFIGINRKLSIDNVEKIKINVSKGKIYYFLKKIDNFFFRSFLYNNWGLKGIPYYNFNRKDFIYVTLSSLFSRFFGKFDIPYKDKTGTCKKILDMCKDDNKKLDKKYKLGLKKYGYY